MLNLLETEMAAQGMQANSPSDGAEGAPPVLFSAMRTYHKPEDAAWVFELPADAVPLYTMHESNLVRLRLPVGPASRASAARPSRMANSRNHASDFVAAQDERLAATEHSFPARRSTVETTTANAPRRGSAESAQMPCYMSTTDYAACYRDTEPGTPATSASLSALSLRRIPTELRARLTGGGGEEKGAAQAGTAAAAAGHAASPPPFRGPNVFAVPEDLVSMRASFAMPGPPVSPPATAAVSDAGATVDHDGCSYEVRLHVYDLSSGGLEEYAEQLLGEPYPGVYHSGIVCYGLEFYFEGGIAVAGAGRTRFGTHFTSLSLGYTTRRLPEFMAWVREKEVTTYPLSSYHLVRFNCHNFSAAAAAYLLQREDNVLPLYLFTTVKGIYNNEVGNAAMEAVHFVTRSFQFLLTRQLHACLVERQLNTELMTRAAVQSGVRRLPPHAVVLFRVVDKEVCRGTLQALQPYLIRLAEQRIVAPAAASEALNTFTEQVVSGADTLDARCALAYVEMVTEVLARHPLTLWAPVLNGLRVAMLHKTVLLNCAFHTDLMALLQLASRDFARLLPAGKLALLRVVCNFSGASVGATLHKDPRYAQMWVALIGLGLMEGACNGAIVYTAACLAMNVALSLLVTPSPWAKPESTSHSVNKSPCMRLITVLLYNLRYRSPAQLPEPSFNMVLYALLRLMSSSAAARSFLSGHALRPRYDELLQRALTRDSRALLCLMRTLEQLHQ